MSPSNNEVLITFQGGQAVEVRQGSAKKTIELGMNSTGAAFTKDNRKIYIANFNNGQMTIIE